MISFPKNSLYFSDLFVQSCHFISYYEDQYLAVILVKVTDRDALGVRGVAFMDGRREQTSNLTTKISASRYFSGILILILCTYEIYR